MRSPLAMVSVANTPLPWMGERRAAIFFLGIAWIRTTARTLDYGPSRRRRAAALHRVLEDDAPEPGPVERHAQAERDPEHALQTAPHAPCDEDGADRQQPAQQLRRPALPGSARRVQPAGGLEARAERGVQVRTRSNPRQKSSQKRRARARFRANRPCPAPPSPPVTRPSSSPSWRASRTSSPAPPAWPSAPAW